MPQWKEWRAELGGGGSTERASTASLLSCCCSLTCHAPRAAGPRTVSPARDETSETPHDTASGHRQQRDPSPRA